MTDIFCPIECVKDDVHFIKQNETFLLTITATISGIVGLLLSSCLKSRCSSIKCWGLNCIREPIPITTENNNDNNI